jgi:hypothetical protein
LYPVPSVAFTHTKRLPAFHWAGQSTLPWWPLTSMPATVAWAPMSDGTLFGIWAVPSCARICEPISWSYFLTYASIAAWSPAGVAAGSAWAGLASPASNTVVVTATAALSKPRRLPRHTMFMGSPF